MLKRGNLRGCILAVGLLSFTSQEARAEDTSHALPDALTTIEANGNPPWIPAEKAFPSTGNGRESLGEAPKGLEWLSKAPTSEDGCKLRAQSSLIAPEPLPRLGRVLSFRSPKLSC